MTEVFDSSKLKKKSAADADGDSTKKELERGHKHSHDQKKDHKRRRTVDDYSAVMRQEKPTTSSIRAYSPKPRGVGFSTQNIDEDIVLLLRQHPITQLKWVIVALLLILAPLLFTSIGMFSFLPDNFYAAGLIGWYLMVVGFSVESFLKWFYNVYIVTDERIIDVDFVSLIHSNVSAAKIDNIEDVTARAAGFAATLFDYGTVYIQTAADKREFEFEGVPHPNKVTSLINEMMIEEEREKLEGRVS